jgi:hypothetical protein
MKQRCLNQRSRGYQRYGARGISVCDRWLSFENFLADMGGKPEPQAAYSLDRIDGNGNYEPGNCRWATASQQQRNRPNYNPRNKARACAAGCECGKHFKPPCPQGCSCRVHDGREWTPEQRATARESALRSWQGGTRKWPVRNRSGE